MRHRELTEEEAARVSSRLLRLGKRRKWSRARLAREAGISRKTLYNLAHRLAISPETVDRICEKLKWSYRQTTMTPAQRSNNLHQLLTPGMLANASKSCTDASDTLRLHILQSAISILHTHLLGLGFSAKVFPPTSIEAKEARISVLYSNGLPRATVVMWIDSRRLAYTLIQEGPAGAKTVASGPATELGFRFCIEFLTHEHAREKPSIGLVKSDSVIKHFEKYGRARRSGSHDTQFR